MSVAAPSLQQAKIEAVEAGACEIPTATDIESDGTFEWSSASVVVAQVHAHGRSGLGYTYCHPAERYRVATGGSR